MKSLLFPLMVSGGVALLALGCGGGQQSKHVHGGGPMAVVCPMPVAGTTVEASDVDGGAALTFTTTTDVGELRQRVRRMAELHNTHPAREQRPAPSSEGAAQGPIPASIANSVDVENGAQLTLVPKSPSELATLREHARQHAGKITRGDCGPAK